MKLTPGEDYHLTTHDLEHGLRASTRAVIIDRGKVVFDQTGADKATRDAYEEYVRVGTVT
jgi:ABC-type uncharacterized transport system ATPase component